VIAPRHDVHFFQCSRVYVQGDIEAIEGVDVLNRIFRGGAAQIGEIDGIIIWNGDLVAAGRVGYGTAAGAAHDGHPVKGSGPVHIKNRSVDGDLSPGATTG